MQNKRADSLTKVKPVVQLKGSNKLEALRRKELLMVAVIIVFDIVHFDTIVDSCQCQSESVGGPCYIVLH